MTNVILAGRNRTAMAHAIYDRIANPISINKYEYQELLTTKFSDGELSVQLTASVRGKNVFLIETVNNAEESLEILMTLDALRRNGAEKIYLVNPYYAYCRQDKMEGDRGAIGAKVFADLYQSYNIAGIITVDIHSPATQGFFNCAFINIRGVKVYSQLLQDLDKSNLIICSPDQGGVVRASKFAEALDVNMVTINKKRLKANEIHSMMLVGDVKDKDILIVDDMADTCGTLSKAVEYLLAEGAKSVSALVTHAILSGKAFDNLSKSKLKKLYISDTYNTKWPEYSTIIKINAYTSNITIPNCDLVIEQISCIELLSKTIKTVVEGGSIHQLNS